MLNASKLLTKVSLTKLLEWGEWGRLLISHRQLTKVQRCFLTQSMTSAVGDEVGRWRGWEDTAQFRWSAQWGPIRQEL